MMKDSNLSSIGSFDPGAGMKKVKSCLPCAMNELIIDFYYYKGECEGEGVDVGKGDPRGSGSSTKYSFWFM